MAERRAVNKYYPPDWDPSKGSINAYNKSHPLRKRARKIDQGILVVRFEMPFSIWCLGCDNHIGMGVRYNAEKSKVGNYYTSPIYQFKMKCHLCDNYFLIETDPSKFDYIVKEGARRQVRMSDETKDEQTVEPSSLAAAEEAKRRITDSMFRLEKKIEDKMKSEADMPNLRDIKKWRDQLEDSFSMNQLVRSQYRKRRKKLEQAKSRDRKLSKKACLSIPLVKPKSSDVIHAKQLITNVKRDKDAVTEFKRKAAILDCKEFLQSASHSEAGPSRQDNTDSKDFRRKSSRLR